MKFHFLPEFVFESVHIWRRPLYKDKLCSFLPEGRWNCRLKMWKEQSFLWFESKYRLITAQTNIEMTSGRFLSQSDWTYICLASSSYIHTLGRPHKNSRDHFGIFPKRQTPLPLLGIWDNSTPQQLLLLFNQFKSPSSFILLFLQSQQY